jgi:hypothetical protein
VLTALAVALCAAVLSPAFGYGADVRERMMVRNLAPTQLDDSVRPVVARDTVAGAGIFSYSSGPMGFGWPLISAGPDSLPYNIAVLDTSGRLLSRTRIPVWGTWDSVFDVGSPGNQPMFETHNIASSRDSDKVCITWVRTDTSPMPGFYRLSTDAGANWGPVQELDRPAAYGGDTAASFHVSSLYPFYDDRGRLHVMAAVHPVVHDTAYIMPAGIWHWCPNNNPNWQVLRRAGCAPQNLAAPVGYNALYACRPSGDCVGGSLLLVAWEQFDSANVEPQTNLLRADIHVCLFETGGAYLETLRITGPGPYSCRFPSTAAFVPSESAVVVYEVDKVAGFSLLGQGRATHNAVEARFLWFPMAIRLGQLDTVGGTTYDLQTCGPARSVARGAVGRGVHALWTWSEDTTGSFPELNMRYNFYDFGGWGWNWIDPDFMQSGVNVFPYRAGLGCMDVDPATGIAVISGCTHPPLPHVAVEENPKPRAASPKPTATIVRGVLSLQSAIYNMQSEIALLDISGRKVLDLQPGPNDVSHLAPGVYFVREAQAQAHAQAVRKVVLTK